MVITVIAVTLCLLIQILTVMFLMEKDVADMQRVLVKVSSLSLGVTVLHSSIALKVQKNANFIGSIKKFDSRLLSEREGLT